MTWYLLEDGRKGTIPDNQFLRRTYRRYIVNLYRYSMRFLSMLAVVRGGGGACLLRIVSCVISFRASKMAAFSLRLHHRGKSSFVQFCLCENPTNRWLSMKKSARRCVL